MEGIRLVMGEHTGDQWREWMRNYSSHTCTRPRHAQFQGRGDQTANSSLLGKAWNGCLEWHNIYVLDLFIPNLFVYILFLVVGFWRPVLARLWRDT